MKTCRNLLLPVLLILLLTTCRQEESYRIAVAQFIHETCTFCPGETGIADFEYYSPPLSGEELLRGNNYIEGFMKMATELGHMEITGITSPGDARGGSSGSWITREAFDKYVGLMARDLQEKGPFDGLFLSLHGAMAVTGIPKPEAELVKRLREVAGDIPIFITMDLHANEDQAIAEGASGVFITKRYPHYDEWLQGERAARVMLATLRGAYSPVFVVRKPKVITPSVFQGTGVSPAMEIMEKARRWEERIPGVYVSVAFGFAYADVPDAGASVMVITNNDSTLAREIADDVTDYIWRLRKEFAGKVLPKTEEGVRLGIAAAREGKTPVVLADHSDRTGNSTHLLAELIRQGASHFCIATLSDSLALQQIVSAGLQAGDAVDIRMGGYADAYAGEPVPIQGKLEYLGPYGYMDPVAVILFGEQNRVILTPVLHQVTTPHIFEALNIPMEEMDIIVLKSRVHFRRGFYENGLAGAIYEVDAPGLGPADLTTVPYRNIPKDLYPVYVKD